MTASERWRENLEDVLYVCIRSLIKLNRSVLSSLTNLASDPPIKTDPTDDATPSQNAKEVGHIADIR